MVKILRVNGKSEEICQQNKKITFDEVKKALGMTKHDLIQPIFFRDGHVMLCDEEGKLKGQVVNTLASTIAVMSMAIMPNDCVVGDVVFCEYKEVDWD